MYDDIGDGFISTFESLAKTFVVAAVLWWLFLIVAWPFISVARVVLFIISFGHISPSYRQSLEHQGVVGVALLLFLPTVFYVHIVYGAHWYGNQS